MSAELIKLTVNLTAGAVEALNEAAAICGHTRTDTVNRALRVYAAIAKASAAGGGTVSLEFRDGAGETDVIVLAPGRVS